MDVGFCYFHDKKEGQLFASRDRFGVNLSTIYNSHLVLPLHLNKRLCWQALIQFKPNSQALFDYWIFSNMEREGRHVLRHNGAIPCPEHDFNIATGELKKWKYYTLPYNNKYDTASFNEKDAISKIRSLVVDSVKLRLRSDVTVGSCLSGGLDSSSIVGSCIIQIIYLLIHLLSLLGIRILMRATGQRSCLTIPMPIRIQLSLMGRNC